MTYDKKIADLFLLNFNEAYRSAKLLMSSYLRLTDIIPLKEEFFRLLDMESLDKLDAFRVRYCDLQDSLGNKVFRSILLLEEELPGSNLDTLNKMEKRGIIQSFDDWKALRNIRNLFAHDYPETDQSKVETLNIAYLNTPKLINVLDTTTKYMQETLHLNMDQFPSLAKK